MPKLLKLPPAETRRQFWVKLLVTKLRPKVGCRANLPFSMGTAVSVMMGPKVEGHSSLAGSGWKPSPRPSV